MSSLKYILCIFSFVQFCKCSLFSTYYNRIRSLEYYVTSTSLLIFDSATKFERSGKSLTCEIHVEKNVSHKMSLHLKDIDLVNSKTMCFMCEENITQDCSLLRETNIDVVDGFILSKHNSSFVTGYIKDFSFYGTVFVDNTTYYVEDLGRYPEIYNKFTNLGYNAVIFKDKILNLPFPQTQADRKWPFYDKNVNFLKKSNDGDLYKLIIGKGKVCSLFILIDNSFLRLIHNGNLKAAVAQTLGSLEEVSSLFRSTDFDGDGYPDNIGFIIKYFVVLQSEQSPMNLLPKYSSSPIDARLYLTTFSQYTLLNEVCLGIAFTGHTFKDNVLGLSYTAQPSSNSSLYSIGGICDRPFTFQAGKNLNALTISSLVDGTVVPQFTFDLCLAHELGHSFGSKHDTSPTCEGYLMTAYAPSDSQRKRFLFSSCSKEIIVRAIISKGHCFENYEGPYCGNGIIEEEEEECDCGTIRDCKSLDACCIPRGQKNACKANKKDGFDCHPSQGICCTSKCKYNNLLLFDLDCRNFEEKCPCQESESCRCGVGGVCTRNLCSSEECTRMSLSECVCPVNVAQSKCRTCCLFNDLCLPSHNVSEKVINNNRTLITTLLERFQNVSERKSEKFGYYKLFCYDSFCIELYFRQTNSGEYCLNHGRVGICNKSFQCTLPKHKRIFPSLQIFDKNCSVVFGLFSQLLIFNLCAVYQFFIVLFYEI